MGKAIEKKEVWGRGTAMVRFTDDQFDTMLGMIVISLIFYVPSGIWWGIEHSFKSKFNPTECTLTNSSIEVITYDDDHPDYIAYSPRLNVSYDYVDYVTQETMSFDLQLCNLKRPSYWNKDGDKIAQGALRTPYVCTKLAFETEQEAEDYGKFTNTGCWYNKKIPGVIAKDLPISSDVWIYLLMSPGILLSIPLAIVIFLNLVDLLLMLLGRPLGLDVFRNPLAEDDIPMFNFCEYRPIYNTDAGSGKGSGGERGVVENINIGGDTPISIVKFGPVEPVFSKESGADNDGSQDDTKSLGNMEI